MHKAEQTYASKAYAEAWLAEEYRLIDRGDWIAPSRRAKKQAGLTLGEFFEQEVARRATRPRRPLAPTTVDLYRKDWRLGVSPLSDELLEDITPSTVSKWWAGLDEGTPTQNGRSYDLLKSILNSAVDEELIERNPCRMKGVGKPEPKRTGVALTVTEVLTYLSAVPEQYRLLLMLAVWCGLRSGEVRGLRRCDIDLKDRVIRVRQAVSRVRLDDHNFTWRIDGPKTKAGVRDAAMPDVLVEPLKSWLADLPMTGREGLIFTASNGISPLHDSVLREAHVKGRNAIGRGELTIHDLRRTCATLAAQGGASLSELMRLLGHTTVNMAMVYQVATDERDRLRAERLNEQIRRAQG